MQFTILTETIMYLVLTPPPPKKKKKIHISIVFDFLRQLWYPGEIGNNGYANIFLRRGGGAVGVNKVHYGLCEDGESKN